MRQSLAGHSKKKKKRNEKEAKLGIHMLADSKADAILPGAHDSEDLTSEGKTSGGAGSGGRGAPSV